MVLQNLINECKKLSGKGKASSSFKDPVILILLLFFSLAGLNRFHNLIL